MEGNSVNRFKEILKVFTKYGLGYILGKKEDKIKNSPANLIFTMYAEEFFCMSV